MRFFREIIAVGTATLSLKLSCCTNELPDHVKLGPMDLRRVIKFEVRIAFVRTPKIRRVDLPINGLSVNVSRVFTKKTLTNKEYTGPSYSVMPADTIGEPSPSASIRRS